MHADPNGVDWNYPQGNAYANTTANVAAYYGRLLSWLVKVSDDVVCGVWYVVCAHLTRHRATSRMSLACCTRADHSTT